MIVLRSVLILYSLFTGAQTEIRSFRRNNPISTVYQKLNAKLSTDHHQYIITCTIQ